MFLTLEFTAGTLRLIVGYIVKENLDYSRLI